MWFFKRKKKNKEETKVVNKEVHETKVDEPVNETKKVAPTKPQEEKLQEENVAKPKKPAKYHISQNKDTNSEFFKKWRVRKEGSQKTIKYFNTQVEAIDYAQTLADSAGSSIVIHKLDGSIRKQEYKK